MAGRGEAWRWFAIAGALAIGSGCGAEPAATRSAEPAAPSPVTVPEAQSDPAAEAPEEADPAETADRRPAVEGRVLDPDGTPVGGAVVQWWPSGAEPRPGDLVRWARFQGPSVTTDGDGGFRITGLVPGPIVLLVRAPGFVVARVSETVPADFDVLSVPVTLDRGASIAGFVTDAEGRPVADAAVVCVSAPGGWITHPSHDDHWRVVRTDDAGRFRAARLVSGPYDVFARTDDLVAEGAVEVLVDPRSGAENVRVRLVPSRTISGVFRCEGIPVAWAEVRARREGDGWSPTGIGTIALFGEGLESPDLLAALPRVRAKTDGDGRFAVHDVTDGPWTIEVQPARDDGTDALPVRRRGVAAGTEGLEIEALRGVRVSGEVFCADGTPVETGLVWLTRTDRHDGFGDPPETGCFFVHWGDRALVAGGRFEFRRVREGRYDVEVTVPGHWEERRGVEVGEDGVTVLFPEAGSGVGTGARSPLSIRLAPLPGDRLTSTPRPGGDVTALVRFPDGRVVAGGWVKFRRSDERGVHGPCITDPDGRTPPVRLDAGEWTGQFEVLDGGALWTARREFRVREHETTDLGVVVLAEDDSYYDWR